MTRQDGDHTYTLKLTVRNKPGVLVRCAQIFGRRGHNIESLNVAHNPADYSTSIMTITAFGAHGMMQQIALQLAKLVDVTSIVTEERN